MATRIYIADDHQMFLEALEMIINLEDGFDVIGRANDGLELLDDFRANDFSFPDIIVIDINMPRLDGIKTVEELVKMGYKGGIIILSSMTDTRLVHESMKKGADAFLCKRCARKEIIQAIRSVSAGQTFFGETINKQLLETLLPIQKKKKEVRNHLGQFNSDPYLFNQLTDREKSVLRLIALEYTSKEIAEQLFIAQSTVDTYRKRLIEKLKVKNSVGLGKIALINGIV